MKNILWIVAGGAVLVSGIHFLSESGSSPERDNDFSVTRSYESGDRDCGDFSTHRQAQAFFEAEGLGDPHGLDRDSDGIACETLP